MRYINYNIKGSFSSLLKERPTFVSGFTSLFRVHQRKSLRGYLNGNNVDDMRQDWWAVGNDLRNAMQSYGKR